MTTPNQATQSPTAGASKNNKTILIIIAAVLLIVCSICACLAIIGFLANNDGDDDRQSEQQELSPYEQPSFNTDPLTQCLLSQCSNLQGDEMNQCIASCSDQISIQPYTPDSSGSSSQDALVCARYQDGYNDCMESYNLMEDGVSKTTTYQLCQQFQENIYIYCP